MLFAAVALLGSPMGASKAVEISETSFEGRPHFRIESPQCTWFFDRSGGGFSRLLDRQGLDWISFRKAPLSEYPASAAAGYRGMPNCVFVGPDKGAGHPGFDRCQSEQVTEDTIRTRSHSGQWQWSWTFTDSTASFTMEKAPDGAPWWFLYEGPIAGTFDPTWKIWGTDSLGARSDVPTNRSQLFGNWQWIYVADRRIPRALAIVQVEPDELPDTLWYLGSSQSGAATAKDGMVVVGFGRGPQTKPELTGNGHAFKVGLIELESTENLTHAKISTAIEQGLAPP